jgi:hypothetical protein
MNRALKRQFRSFGLEILVYGALIAGYLLLVLRYLGDWLHNLFLHDRVTYAFIALALVVAQGAVLERATRLLLHWIKPEKGDQ